MSLDAERHACGATLIPDGPSAEQRTFWTAASLAYASGTEIQDAVDFGTEQARKTGPAFVPVYDVAFLTLG